MDLSGTSSLSYNYNDKFYEEITDDSVKSARQVVPWLYQSYEPDTVVDIGCGAGAWTREFINAGCMVFGVDGEWARQSLLIPEESFISLDISRPVFPEIGSGFDMCICLEVAEHLPFSRSVSLVEDLCALSNVVVFSAAIPGQGGHGHINEQPHQFWLKLFHNQGYIWDRTPQIIFRDNTDVAWWYSQNMYVFEKE
jgi:SAM-dependent methyltransferase